MPHLPGDFPQDAQGLEHLDDLEGMDRFELRVGQADLDQERYLVLLVQEDLERAERRRHFVRGRGGTNVAWASVQPAGPIHFWVRRSSPGVRRKPRRRRNALER
jgi:hypothetical protein